MLTKHRGFISANYQLWIIFYGNENPAGTVKICFTIKLSKESFVVLSVSVVWHFASCDDMRVNKESVIVNNFVIFILYAL
jgi:hypothetical protein